MRGSFWRRLEEGKIFILLKPKYFRRIVWAYCVFVLLLKTPTIMQSHEIQIETLSNILDPCKILDLTKSPKNPVRDNKLKNDWMTFSMMTTNNGRTWIKLVHKILRFKPSEWECIPSFLSMNLRSLWDGGWYESGVWKWNFFDGNWIDNCADCNDVRKYISFHILTLPPAQVCFSPLSNLSN